MSQAIPVPHPVETRIVTITQANADLSEEQRERVKDWLTANGIQPRTVASGHPITVHYRTRPDRGTQTSGVIHFTQYVEDENGHRMADPGAGGSAAVFSRRAHQQVAIDPDPSWNPTAMPEATV